MMHRVLATDISHGMQHDSPGHLQAWHVKQLSYFKIQVLPCIWGQQLRL